MDERFFRPKWSQPAMHSRHRSYDGENPIRSPQPFVNQIKPQVGASTPKVVQIPVHFVNSERFRSDSALKIQKVFRRFLTRNSVKKILQLKREADEIEHRISRSDTIELIRRDQRERLRINEMLMALLIKLDSIRGFDNGVRDCRKAVIKKVIAMQEGIDDIVSSVPDQIQYEDPTESERNVSSMVSSANNSEEVPGSRNSNSEDECEQDTKPGEKEVEGFEWKFVEKEPNPEDCLSGGDLEMTTLEKKCVKDEAGQIREAKVETRANEEHIKGDGCVEDLMDSVMTSHMEESLDVKETGEFRDISSNLEESEVGNETGEVCDTTTDISECMEETMEMHPRESNGDEAEVNDDASEKSLEVNGGETKESRADDMMMNQQVLQRLMEDNQKVMNLMTQLFDKNEKQTQILNTLRCKVKQLEKALMCDRTRRKKKRLSP